MERLLHAGLTRFTVTGNLALNILRGNTHLTGDPAPRPLRSGESVLRDIGFSKLRSNRPMPHNYRCPKKNERDAPCRL